MGFFDDPNTENEFAWGKYSQSLMKQNIDAATIARIKVYAQAYPHVDPRVVVPLARAGFAPDDPTVQKIAAMSVKEQQQKSEFGVVGDIIGSAKNAVGNVLAPVGNALGSALSPLDPAAQIAKGAVRTAAVVLESGGQNIGNFFRAQLYTEEHLGEDLTNGGPGAVASRFSGALLGQKNSAGEALGQLAAGRKVDLGTGFLPGGKVEQAVRASAGTVPIDVNGVHFGGPGQDAATPGRALAATIFEPGTNNYKALSGLTDAAVAWNADPTNVLLEAATKGEALARVTRGVNEARDSGSLIAGAKELAVKPTLADLSSHNLQANVVDRITGMLPGNRPTFLPDVSDSWLTKEGNRTVQELTKQTDPQIIHEATNRKLPIALSNALADTRTDQETIAALKPYLGSEVRDTPQYLGIKVQASNRQGIRLLDMMPGKSLDPNNLEDGYVQLDRALHNMKASAELRAASLKKFMGITDQSQVRSTVQNIMADAADELAPRLTNRGITSLDRLPDETDAAFQARQSADVLAQKRVRAGRLIHMSHNDSEALRFYAGDEIIANEKAAGVINAGEGIPAQSPFLSLEYTNNAVPLPDARDLRRATSTLGRMVDNPLFENTVDKLDWLTQKWKQSHVIRPAMGLRVLATAQARMAAADVPNMFTHPADLIGSLIADPENAAAFIGKGRINQVDVFGKAMFGDDAEAALVNMNDLLSKKMSDLAGRYGNTTTYHVPVHLGDPGYEKAWQGGLHELYADPIAREAAGTYGNADTFKESLWANQSARLKQAERYPDILTPAGSDQYADNILKLLKYRTGEDEKTLEAISTGLFDGKPWGGLNEKGAWEPSAEFANHLKGVQGPSVVKGVRGFRNGRELTATNQFVDRIMDTFVTNPHAKLDTIPTAGAFYAKRMEEQLPFMDDATRAKALAWADGVVPKDQLARMQKVTKGSGAITSLADADIVAKKWAMDQTKELLYDFTDKSQFSDAMRLIFPFGDIWRREISTWAKLAWQNPRLVNRARQIVTAAQGNPNAGTVLETDPITGKPTKWTGDGFFHKDQYGDEVFNIPFARNISKMLIGVPVEMTGRTAGLSMLADAVPGVGPVLQLPAAAVLPNTPTWDLARNIITPFGSENYKTGVLDSVLPSWAKNLKQVFDKGDPRAFSSTMGAVTNYLASTGDYDLNDPTSMNQMISEATAIAKRVYVLRTAAGLLSPDALTPTFLAQVTGKNAGKNGDALAMQWSLAADYRRMVLENKGDYDAATDEFVTRYGKDALLSTQPSTMSLTPPQPVSSVASDWERSHPDVVKDYRLTWSLYAPQGDPNDFDNAAYQRQIERGDRTVLTPTQRIQNLERDQGAHIYAQAQTKVGPHPSQAGRQWLAYIHEKIKAEYPAYGQEVPALPAKYAADYVVSELRKSSADPRLAKTDQAKAATIYLQARDKAIKAAQQLGATANDGKALSIQSALPVRLWLGDIGRKLIAQYPSFAPFYNAVFLREVDSPNG